MLENSDLGPWTLQKGLQATKTDNDVYKILKLQTQTSSHTHTTTPSSRLLSHLPRPSLQHSVPKRQFAKSATHAIELAPLIGFCAKAGCALCRCLERLRGNATSDDERNEATRLCANHYSCAMRNSADSHDIDNGLHDAHFGKAVSKRVAIRFLSMQVGTSAYMESCRSSNCVWMNRSTDTIKNICTGVSSHIPLSPVDLVLRK